MARQTFAERARQYLDEKPTSSKLDRQSAETENHGDRETASDPNAMGPAMRTPYAAAAPRFDDAKQAPDGMGQIHGEENDGYPFRDGRVLGAVPDRSTRQKGYPTTSVPGLSPDASIGPHVADDVDFPDFPDRKGRSRDRE